jgi:hypothetical protein
MKIPQLADEAMWKNEKVRPFHLIWIAYELFSKNPYNPNLHFKRIHATRPIFSDQMKLPILVPILNHFA